MNKVYFVYSNEFGYLVKKIEQNHNEIIYMSVKDFLTNKNISSSDRVIILANYDEIKLLFQKAQDEGFIVSLVADKTQQSLIDTFEIDVDIEKSIDISIHSEPKSLDLLYVEDEIVLWSSVIGNAPPIGFKNASYLRNSFKSRYELFIESLKKFKTLRRVSVKITTAKEQEINTAVNGIVIIEHDNHTCASSLISNYLSVCDGKLSALLISPNSIVDYLKYLYKAIFKKDKKSLPDSVGLIKSESLSIDAVPPLEVKIDGKKYGQTPVQIKVIKKAIKFCASEKFWQQKKELPSSDKETIKLDGLPVSKEAILYQQGKLPLFAHASEDRYKDLFSSLREQARLESTFIVLMILSTTLATVGLFLNSSSVVIGAMLLAPLMQPIVSASMGILRDDKTLLINAFKTVFFGVFLVLLTSSMISLILPFNNLTSEISARLRPSLLDLIVAITSGIAAAYAKNNEKIIGSLAGVSIAVALVPPISTAGIGIGWMRFDIFYQAFLLFITNFVGIIFSAGLTFLILGYSPIKRAKKGLGYALIFALIVSIPLYLSFKSMVYDSNIITTLQNSSYTLNGKKLAIEHVSIEHRGELRVKCELLTPRLLSEGELERLKSKLKHEIDIKDNFLLEVIQRVKI